MTDNTFSYAVIEDNGGGLHLFVFDADENTIYAHSGYETNPGQLTQDLDALDGGADPREWEGCNDDPDGDWESITGSQYGWKNIAHTVDGKRTLFPERMGAAGRIEFGITDD